MAAGDAVQRRDQVDGRQVRGQVERPSHLLFEGRNGEDIGRVQGRFGIAADV